MALITRRGECSWNPRKTLKMNMEKLVARLPWGCPQISQIDTDGFASANWGLRKARNPQKRRLSTNGTNYTKGGVLVESTEDAENEYGKIGRKAPLGLSIDFSD
ncbi:hypothetical protein ACFFF3_09490 [Mongoliitalea lutea]